MGVVKGTRGLKQRWFLPRETSPHCLSMTQDTQWENPGWSQDLGADHGGPRSTSWEEIQGEWRMSYQSGEGKWGQESEFPQDGQGLTCEETP